MAATYPDTTLKDDVLDPSHGGRPATEFGGLAWQWTDNIIRFLGQAYLDYLRQPYAPSVVLMQTSVAPGDVVVTDLATFAAGGAYYARKAAAGDGALATARVLGVCIVGAAGGSKARVAVGGIIPRQYTGFATLGAGQAVGVDFAAGRLRAALGGDAVVGYGDPRGNVLLLYLGRPG